MAKKSIAAGSVAVITGAGSGIGRALAFEFAALGCSLALADINRERAEQTCRDLLELNKTDPLAHSALEAKAFVVDVANRQAMHELAGRVQQHFGRVDIVVNNAGVASSTTINAASWAEFDKVVNVNLWGVVHGSKEFLPYLSQSPSAYLVNISSMFGLAAAPQVGLYAMTKFAVRGFTEALRQELHGSNVHVACIHPGFIRTALAESVQSDDASAAQSVTNRMDQLSTMDATRAAKIIVKGLLRRKHRILVGRDAYFIDWLQRLMPVGYARFTRRQAVKSFN